MNFINCLTILSLFQVGVAKETVPVFIIDYDEVIGHLFVDPNPFGRTSSLLFTDIIEDAMKQASVLILFVEELFCTEDISAKDDRGTPFDNLHENMLKYKVKYFPNVVNPIGSLTRLLKPTQPNVFVLKPGQRFELVENLKFFYVFFKDNKNESRIETLRRHDAIMHEVYDKTRRAVSGAVIAIYTGKVNPVLIPKFDHEVSFGDDFNNPDQGVYVMSQGVLFRFIGMSIQRGDRTRRSEYAEYPFVVSELRRQDDEPPPPPENNEKKEEEKEGKKEEKKDEEVLKTKLEFQGLHLEFNFKLTEKFWYLNNITLFEGGENLGSTTLNLKVPIGNSYYCDEPLTVVHANDGSFVYIPEYQIQPFQSEVAPAQKPPAAGRRHVRQDDEEEGGGEAAPPPPAAGPPAASGKNFSKAIYCNPYFNVPILSGLFVTGICIVILLIGVVSLYSCQTNNHFDDPHAKQLVFSTAE